MNVSLMADEDNSATPGDVTSLVKDLKEATATTDITPDSVGGSPAKSKERPTWCPEKFWDAEKGEVLSEKLGSSYLNLESSHGRMANDLGQQRALTDKLLDLNRATPKNPASELPKVTTQELLDKPAEVLDKLVRERLDQELAKINEKNQTIERTLAEEKIRTKHPDFMEVGQSAEFRAWIESSAARTAAAQSVGHGNYRAAEELLTEYKALKKASATTAASNDSARKAALESGSTAGSSSSSKGKTYSRVSLMRLKMQNPDLYYNEDFQKEILKAYSEGRVK